MGKNVWAARPLDPQLDPWERQPRETDEAWQAFVRYRDAERRRLHTVAADAGKHHSLIERWSVQWSWVARCRAHDQDIDERSRKALVRDIVAYRKRAASQAERKAAILSMIDSAIAQRLNVEREALTKMSLETLVSLAIRAGQALPGVLKAEALALGDVTERPDGPSQDDVMGQEIRNNANARAYLAAAIQQLGSGAGAAGGVRHEGEPGAVAERAAPDVSRTPSQ